MSVMLLRLNNSCSPDAQYGDIEEQLSAFQKVPEKCSRNSAEETDRYFLSKKQEKKCSIY